MLAIVILAHYTNLKQLFQFSLQRRF